MERESQPASSLPDLPNVRPLMFSIAYRMLGEVAEAEDVVQEAFLKLHVARKEGVDVASPKAYLATITTRLAIDHLRSARVKRESYVGQWLPEPVVDQRESGMARSMEMSESLSMAFLLLLETLSPTERAVYLLREVFDYGYQEISKILEKSEENCRQMFGRAKRHVEAGRPRFEASHEKRDALAREFLAACRDGNLESLVRLLADDAVMVGDGGGKAFAAKEPVTGRERVARFVHGIFTKGQTLGGRMRPATVNGQPGALLLDPQDQIVGVLELNIADGVVQSIRAVINPDKLHHLGTVSEMLQKPSQ